MNKGNTSLGVIVGLILCTLFSLAFPQIVHITGWAVWLFYILGYVWGVLALLCGCSELLKEKQR